MMDEAGEDLELPDETSSWDGAVGAGVKGESPPKEAEGEAAGGEVEAKRGAAEAGPRPCKWQTGLWRSRTVV